MNAHLTGECGIDTAHSDEDHVPAYVPPRDCKSPAHKRYADAVEGLYIQTWIASRDLAKLLDGLGGTNADEKGTALVLSQHKLDEVTERIAFGKSELALATDIVNRHFDRGCRNIPAEIRA